MMSSIPKSNMKTFGMESGMVGRLNKRIVYQLKSIFLVKGWLFLIVGFLLGRAVILSAVSPLQLRF